MSDEQEFPAPGQWDDRQARDLDVEELFPSDDLVESKTEAALRKANQTHDFRDRFFTTISGSLIGILLSSVLVMLLYVISQWGEVSGAAVVSFNAAVVVNVLGLALILANYLFPKGGGD